MLGSNVISVALNTEHCTNEEAFAFQKEFETKLKLTVMLPLQEGCENIVPVLQKMVTAKNN